MDDWKKELAKHLAGKIFEVGDEPERPTTRIEFKSRLNDHSEVSQGGLCEESLVRVINKILAGDL